MINKYLVTGWMMEEKQIMQMTILKIKVWLSPLETFKYEGKIITCLISNIEKPRVLRQSGMKWLYCLFHEPLVIPASLCASSTLSTNRLSCSLIVSPASNLHFHLTLPVSLVSTFQPQFPPLSRQVLLAYT